MKKIQLVTSATVLAFTMIVGASVATAAAVATPPTGPVPHGDGQPFQVQPGNVCHWLAIYIGKTYCGGEDKVYYIGPDQQLMAKGWCTYDLQAREWKGSLKAYDNGFYSCITEKTK